MHRYFTLVLIAVITPFLCLACSKHQPTPLTPEEIEAIVEGQPQLFVVHNQKISLENFERLYLGQSQDEAMEALNHYCRAIDVFDGGWRHQYSVFKGCLLGDGDHPIRLRVGFSPKFNNRVFTLEVKGPQIPWNVVRARFTQLNSELLEDRARPGILIMASERHRLFANWDGGADGPAHVLIGYNPEALEEL